MNTLMLDSLDRLFKHSFSPAMLRRIEAGGLTDEPWAALESSGFLDLLLPEDAGGAALSLAHAFPLFLSAGYHAVPLPFVQTVLARAWLNAAGVTPPRGAIAISGYETRQASSVLEADNISFGAMADWLLAEIDGQCILLPVVAAQREAHGGQGSLIASLRWQARPHDAVDVSPHFGTSASATPNGLNKGSDTKAYASLAVLSAASHAPLLAGAAIRVLDMTLDYAGQRTQFGKQIGRFQAVQNQISIMAERVYAARMAAQLACQASGWLPQALPAAIGKSRSSEAACVVADIGHAVHGAIGITEEYDLQLYTRRLREWRRAAGTEHFWNMRIGAELLGARERTALSFIIDATHGSTPCVAS